MMVNDNSTIFFHDKEFPSWPSVPGRRQGIERRLALTFFRNWRMEIRDGFVSICMDDALCLKPSQMSLTAGSRNWRLVIAVVVALEWTAGTDELRVID